MEDPREKDGERTATQQGAAASYEPGELHDPGTGSSRMELPTAVSPYERVMRFVTVAGGITAVNAGIPLLAWYEGLGGALSLFDVAPGYAVALLLLGLGLMAIGFFARRVSQAGSAVRLVAGAAGVAAGIAILSVLSFIALPETVTVATDVGQESISSDAFEPDTGGLASAAMGVLGVVMAAYLLFKLKSDPEETMVGSSQGPQ